MSVGDVDFGLEISKGIVGRFAMAGIGFVGAVIFARILGPSGYGTFYVLLALVNVLDNPITGWGVACKKRISEANFPTDEALGSGLIGVSINTLVAIPLIVLVSQYTNLYDVEGQLLPFVALFVAICFFAVTNRILSGTPRFSISEWTDMLRSVFTMPLQLAFVLAGFGAAGMAYGLAVATFLTVPVVIWYIGVRPTTPSRDTVLSVWEYAKFSVPNSFIGTALARIDVLLLGAVLTTTSVGQYQVALKLTLPAMFIGSVASTGLMARVSNRLSKGESVAPDVTNSLSFASILAIPIFFGAAAMPKSLLVTIFGADYAPAAPLLVGLTLYRVLESQKSQLGSTIAGLDRPDVNVYVGVVALVMNLGGGYLLLQHIGLIGIVVSTVLTEALIYAISAFVVKRELSDVGLLPKPLLHQATAGGVMFIVVDQLHLALGVQSWVNLGLLVGAGGTVYFFLLATISEPFRVTVRGILEDALRS